MKRKVIVPILAILFVVAVATFFLFIKEKETINNNPTSVPTSAPVEVPTIEPTKEPAVTPTEVPVVPTAVPTKAPVEVPTETPGCEHKEVVTFFAEETMEEYKYQEICTTCNEVVKEYTVTKEPVPTVTPTSTPTPLPTATPTPTPTSTPTPTPKVECKHEETGVVLVEETKKEYKYQETCDACGAVLDEFTKPKATPTPSPKPTDKPVPTPTPTPKVEVVDETVSKSGNLTIYYADKTHTTIWKEYTGFLPKNATVIFYKSHFKPAYKEVNGTTREYSSLIGDELLLYFEEEKLSKTNEHLSYYMYYYFDGETEEWTSRLVNSDGSFNKHSGLTIEGFHQGANYGGVEVWEGTKKVGYKLTYIDFQSGYDDPRNIYPEDFIYYEDGVIRLYEY